MTPPTFDDYADDYESVLNKSLSVSGETTQEFSHRRILWVKQFLESKKAACEHILDYGCGTGNTLPEIKNILNPHQMTGVDVSMASLERAQNRFGDICSEYLTPDTLPANKVDLIYSSCVYHHIMPDLRADATRYIYESLKPGGRLVIFEVTPWHPGSLYIIKTCPFDKEAVTISPGAFKRLLLSAGFRDIEVRFVFFFPKFMKLFRGIEKYLEHVPLGAQYAICARKPES